MTAWPNFPQPPAPAHAAGGDDDHVRALLAHEGSVHLLAGDHVHTFHLQHMGEVVAQTAQALMLALHHFGEVQKAAQAVLLVQGDGVPALGGHARRFLAGRAAADDHDALVAVRLGAPRSPRAWRR